MNSQIEYHFSKTNIIVGAVILIFTTLLMGLGIFLFIKTLSKLDVAIIGLGFSLIMGLLLFISIPRYLKTKNQYSNDIPALILTQQRLEDNIHGKIITWNEIARIELIENNIYIVTKNAMNKTKPSWFKNPIGAYEYHFKNPYIINTKLLKENKFDLLDHLKYFHSNTIAQ